MTDQHQSPYFPVAVNIDERVKLEVIPCPGVNDKMKLVQLLSFLPGGIAQVIYATDTVRFKVYCLTIVCLPDSLNHRRSGKELVW